MSTTSASAAAPRPGYAVEIKTVQASVIKILIEALKEILTDTVIHLSPAGIKIVSLDNTRTVLVHLKLDATKFEVFHCDTSKNIGVNMLNLYKIIKTLNSNDTLTLYMKTADMNYLFVEIENSEKQTRTTFRLNLLDLDNKQMEIPPVDFNSVITLPSADFQKIVRDAHTLSDFIEIKTVNKELILTCKGDFCTQETVLSDSDNVNVTQEAENSYEIIQGVFNLKYLCMFSRMSGLYKTCDLYIKNDYPLILRYNVASLGEVKLCLAPQAPTETGSE